MAHRLIIAAALGSGNSTIRNVAFSQDIEATLRCMEALGAKWEQSTHLQVTGIGTPSAWTAPLPQFDCGESGSTLRFLIPIALAVAGGGIFTGRGRLMERPQKPYFDLFDEKGISYQQTNGILTVQGTLTPGEYRLPGNVSSQFFTGLLFALSLLDGPSHIVSTTTLESMDYINMTIDAMRAAGVQVETSPDHTAFWVTPSVYQPIEMAVEADWSQAGFWYAAMALGSSLEINGLNAFSSQGDMIVASHFLKLTRPGDVTIDLSGCPDLLPPLAVMASVREGTTSFINGARLRIKESDRLATVHALLTALGGQAEEGADSLTVHGLPHLSGGTVDGANDHRIVMASAIAATACQSPVTVLGAQAVRKSYPDFFDVYQSLGGIVHGL